ncbi:MAG: M48 family metallopeptidase [Betaproteobacteria bacterium]|nr:M48 family metallopeptidase [Betaproteobacteria bacterium]
MNDSFDRGYANPPVPHEVNVSEKSPLLDFLRLSLGLILLVVAVTSGVFFIARWYAPKIPFQQEMALADRIMPIGGEGMSECQREGEAALQALAEQLAKNMDLLPEMRIRIHFSGASEANAYATLGGHIFVMKDLLEHVDSENALAMVLAHEIAHIKHRDPIVSASGGIATALLFSSLIGGLDGGMLLGAALGMTQMRFSRDQEAVADREALAALQRHYGHTRGADEFFNYIMTKNSPEAKIPAFLSTHPIPPGRVAAIHASQSPDAPEPKPLSDTLLQLRTCHTG